MTIFSQIATLVKLIIRKITPKTMIPPPLYILLKYSRVCCTSMNQLEFTITTQIPIIPTVYIASYY